MNRTKFIINKCYHAYFLQLTRVTVAVMTTEHVFDASWRLSARTVAMTVCVAFFEGQTLRYSNNICLQKFDYKSRHDHSKSPKQLVFSYMYMQLTSALAFIENPKIRTVRMWAIQITATTFVYTVTQKVDLNMFALQGFLCQKSNDYM